MAGGEGLREVESAAQSDAAGHMLAEEWVKRRMRAGWRCGGEIPAASAGMTEGERRYDGSEPLSCAVWRCLRCPAV